MSLARSTDPITSHEAGARAHHFAGTHKSIILECLRRYGPSGAGRISELTGLHVTQTSRRPSRDGGLSTPSHTAHQP